MHILLSHLFPGRSIVSFLCPAHISQLPSIEIELGETEVCSSAREKTVPRRCSMVDVLVTNWWGECELEVKPSLTTAAVATCYSVVVSSIYLFLKTSGEFFEVFEMTGTRCLLSPLFFPWRNPKPVAMLLWHTYLENPKLVVINAGNHPPSIELCLTLCMAIFVPTCMSPPGFAAGFDCHRVDYKPRSRVHYW